MNGDDLRRAREKMGLSQAQAARRVGAQVDTFRKWEHNERIPRRPMSEIVATVLGQITTPADELAGLREMVNRLGEEIRGLQSQVTELALTVVRHEADLARLQAPPPRR